MKQQLFYRFTSQHAGRSGAT